MAGLTGKSVDFLDTSGNWMGVILTLTREGPGGLSFNGVVDPAAANPTTAGVTGTPQNNWLYYATNSGSTAFGITVNAGDFVVYDGIHWKTISLSAIDNVLGPVIYKGTVSGNRSSASAAGIINPVKGWLYKIDTTGYTTFGFSVLIGDFVLFTGTNWEKLNQNPFTSVITPVQGGLGITNFVQGDMIYASSDNVWETVPGNTNNTKKFLTQIGNNTKPLSPTWSTITVTDIIGAASLNSPVFTGTPSAPTASITNTSSTLATTAFVNNFVANAINKVNNNQINLIGDITGTGTNTINTTLKTINSSSGAFGSASRIPVITVNSKGLVTAIGQINVSCPWNSITNTPNTLAGYGITNAIKNNIETRGQSVWLDSLYLSGNNTSYWARIFIDGFSTNDRTLVVDLNDSDRLIELFGDITVLRKSFIAGTNTGDQTITLTGDISGSGTGSFVTTLATVNATTGTFGNSSNIPVITVNSKGLVTNVGTIGTFQWAGIIGTPTTLVGYGITDAAPINSPVFTGIPKAPTPSASDNSSSIANTSWVKSQNYISDPSILTNITMLILGGPYNIANSNYIIIVNKTVSESSLLYLPIAVSGKTIIIKDGKGDSPQFPILVQSINSAKIDGSLFYNINKAYDSVTLIFNGTQWNVI